MRINTKRKKGFTLIELIVVIAILAILAAVAVPNFMGITDTARSATENGAAAEFANAINVFNAQAASSAKITDKGKDMAELTAALKGTAPVLSEDISTANVFAKIVISATGTATIDKTQPK